MPDQTPANVAKKNVRTLLVEIEAEQSDWETGVWAGVDADIRHAAIAAFHAGIEANTAMTFPEADIEIIDTAGDSNHYSAKITAQEFRGKSRVEQHKLVYKALEGVMDGNNGILHALALQTKIK